MKNGVWIRSFNASGIEAFESFLDRFEKGEATDVDAHALARDTRFSDLPDRRLMINVPMVASKRSLAKLVCQSFQDAGYAELPLVTSIEYRNMWTWLACRSFHLIRSHRANRSLNDFAYFVCSREWNRFYRHRIAGPARIYWLFRDRPQDASLLLHGHAYEHSDWEEQLAARQGRIRNRDLIATANRLYWDVGNHRPKRGAQTRTRPGTVRRLLSFIDQVDLTYDVNSMTPDQILDLLPAEFDRWKDS